MSEIKPKHLSSVVDQFTARGGFREVHTHACIIPLPCKVVS